MKWIKVYRGPGYPVDPRKVEWRVIRHRDYILTSVTEFLSRYPITEPLLEGGARTPSEMPRYGEARRTLLPTRPERVPYWIQPQRHDAYYSEEYAAALRIMEAATGGQDKAITDEQKMDDLQARARQWTKKFLNPKVLTVAEKKERREAEQYMQGGDPLT